MKIDKLSVSRQNLLSTEDELEADIKVMRGVLDLMHSDNRKIDLLTFCGFDGSRLLGEHSHGARRALFGLTASEWAMQLTVYRDTSNQPSSYAFKQRAKYPIPTIAAYDSTGLIPALEHPDLIKAVEDKDFETVNSFGEGLVGGPHWYAPEPGSSLDDVIVAAIELIPEQKANY